MRVPKVLPHSLQKWILCPKPATFGPKLKFLAKYLARHLFTLCYAMEPTRANPSLWGIWLAHWPFFILVLNEGRGAVEEITLFMNKMCMYKLGRRFKTVPFDKLQTAPRQIWGQLDEKKLSRTQVESSNNFGSSLHVLFVISYGEIAFKGIFFHHLFHWSE